MAALNADVRSLGQELAEAVRAAAVAGAETAEAELNARAGRWNVAGGRRIMWTAKQGLATPPDLQTPRTPDR